MKQEHHVLIRKRQLEIVTIVFTVLVLIALLSAVIVLSTQLHKCRNTPCTSTQCNCETDCLACAEKNDSQTGKTVAKICCRPDQGGPIITPSGTGEYKSCCAKECPS